MNAVIHLFGEVADGCDCAIDLCTIPQAAGRG